MRLSLRFIVPLLLALVGLGYAVLPLVGNLTVRWFVRDLDILSQLIANTVRDTVRDLIWWGDESDILRVLRRVAEDERVYAVALCASAEAPAVAAGTLPPSVRCANLNVFSGPSGHVLTSPQGPLLVSVRPLDVDGLPSGNLVLVHDMSFVTRRSEETRRYVFYLFLGIGVVVLVLTVVIAQLSWRGWVQGMRALLRGEGLLRPSSLPDTPDFRPIARDLRELIRDIESERRPRDDERLAWSPDTLRAVLHDELR